MSLPGTWLWVFGDIRGLRWVLERGTMAFAAHAAARLRGMAPGDRAVLYVTRGAFHNPTRDRAYLAGLVEVTSPPRETEPLEIAGRAFSILVDFTPVRVLPERQGPPVRDLVPRLQFVKRPEVWGQYFRASPIRLGGGDFHVLSDAIATCAKGTG